MKTELEIVSESQYRQYRILLSELIDIKYDLRKRIDDLKLGMAVMLSTSTLLLIIAIFVRHI